MIDHITEKLRELCEESAARFPLDNRKSVEALFGLSGFNPNGVLTDKLKSLISSPQETTLPTRQLLLVARNFAYRRAVHGEENKWFGVAQAIRFHFSPDTFLQPLENDGWPEAIDIARAILVLHPFLSTFRGRHKNVADAAKRLVERSFKLRVREGGFEFYDGELERATKLIQDKITELGAGPFLSNLFGFMSSICAPYERMYMVPRNYTSWDRMPSIPFNFLINLAVSTPLKGQDANDPASIWTDVISLSRDLIATLDLEPYHQIENTSVPREHLESLLREMALFDGLFTLRQWPSGKTPLILREFFGLDRDRWMTSELGWCTTDAIEIYKLVEQLQSDDPVVITRDDLSKRVRADALQSLLPYLAHMRGTVNQAYVSPIGTKSNLMTKPLIQVDPDAFLAVSQSLAGPAFYECIIAVLRHRLPQATAEELTGQGTHRVTAKLFEEAGLCPTFSEKKYKMNTKSEGECDLVFEDETSILFVECKSKAMTSATMAGEPMEALLDFAATLMSSQVQALRHERLLRTFNRIQFRDGTVLEWRNRAILRLTVTLLGHGSLQDRDLFWTLFNPLFGAELVYTEGQPHGSKIDGLNKVLSRMRTEVEAIGQTELHVSVLKSECASLNVGQLPIFLNGIRDLNHFVKRISTLLTYRAFDPVFEFVERTRKGLID
jgi:hypothetical protein